MATIGGVTCTFLHGASSPLKASLEIRHPPGRDRLAAQDLGKGDSGFRFRAVAFAADAAAAATFIAAIEALQGTVVSATDDLGASHTNLLVEAVSPPLRQGRRFISSGAAVNGIRVEIAVEGRVNT